MALDADVIVVGAGLAGLVATAELAEAGRSVLLLDQEPEAAVGGQAYWSFGGLMLVDSPEQRRLGIHDDSELAWRDWLGTAAFDRSEDYWPRQWAQAYVNFAAGEKRRWLHRHGVRFFPLVQWAERGGYHAGGHGNSVPRFHVTWGTGPGILEPFLRSVRAAEERGLVELRFRHKVAGLTGSAGEVDGVHGQLLEPSSASRGAPSSRAPVGDFTLRAQAVLVTAGGIGGNHELVRRNWPSSFGTPPRHMLSGVPDHVDGSMLEVLDSAGAAVINPDRMWHYPEGIANHSPVWSNHGIRILPGPSSLWLDAHGKQFPVPLYPGADTMGSMAHIRSTGYDYSWFVLNRRILGKEFALSGSEQNPDLTGKSLRMVVQRGGASTPAPVAAFLRHGKDFVARHSVTELAAAMNRLTGDGLIDAAALERIVTDRDRQIPTGLGKDGQLMAIRQARRSLVDRLVRVTPPHELTDPAAGPLVAVRLSLLTRKTLGGAHTDLSARVLDTVGAAIPGLYAAGEVAGFGGGGMHGYRALEGTFLGGCLYSGRVAGRAAAAATA